MPPVVVDVAKAEDVRDVVHRTVQALAEGKLVALPTETVYGLAASACNAAAVEKLFEAKGRDPSVPFALAIKSAAEAEDYSPGWSPLAARLARRCWPGPVTLVLEADHPASLVGQLPESVRQYLCPQGTVGLRVPANAVVQDVLRMLPGPIALTSANRSGEPAAVNAVEVVEAVGDSVALVLDDGPAHYGQASSVAMVNGDGLKVLREGVVGVSTLERLSRSLVIMVCTGNTCRSPMAEGLMRRALAEELGCGDDELEDKGLVVASAGLAAASGSPPSREAVTLMAERGIDLEGHAAQQLTDQLVRHADAMITMTRGHRQAIVGHWPDAAPRTKLLIPDGDVADPIGGPLEVYRRCAEQIARGVQAHVRTIVSEHT
ncbi:MAG: L-threonylcarbamoyladenylate synthase [Planctomycetota bacterium]